MKYIFVILFLLISVETYSQEIPIDSTRQINPEISLDFGFQAPNRSHYKGTYGSSLLPTIGLGIAIPPTKRFRLKGDLNFAWNNSDAAKIQQLLINFTGKYYFFLSDIFSASFEGGLVMIREKEEFFASDGSKSGSIKTNGLIGYYLGSEFERKFKNYGTFLHVGYTISRKGAKNIIFDYGGLNVAVGAKIYF